MRIITGALGEDHITSNDDGEFNQGLWGDGLIVLANGNKLSATIIDNNTIRIADGDLIMQGRHALINPNTTEDLTVETCQIGFKRNDLIVARYTIDEGTGYEDISLIVLEGEETTGTPSDPEYQSGNIRTGDSMVEMPLYRIQIGNDAAISAVTRIVEPLKGSISDLVSQLSEAIGKLEVGDVSFTTASGNLVLGSHNAKYVKVDDTMFMVFAQANITANVQRGTGGALVQLKTLTGAILKPISPWGIVGYDGKQYSFDGSTSFFTNQYLLASGGQALFSFVGLCTV